MQMVFTKQNEKNWQVYSIQIKRTAIKRSQSERGDVEAADFGWIM